MKLLIINLYFIFHRWLFEKFISNIDLSLHLSLCFWNVLNLLSIVLNNHRNLDCIFICHIYVFMILTLEFLNVYYINSLTLNVHIICNLNYFLCQFYLIYVLFFYFFYLYLLISYPFSNSTILFHTQITSLLVSPNLFIIKHITNN